MKRFWVFVIICIVSLGIGFTVFRFMTYEETMSISQSVFQVNVGEEIKLDVITEHFKKTTVLSTEITQTGNVLQKIDDFTFTANNGGQAIITISSNSDLIPIKVQVNVGDGTNASPFYVKNAETLASIGKSADLLAEGSVIYPLSRSYSLVTDINLSNVDWTPIGIDSEDGFTGRFDFNGHKIIGLTMSGEFTSAGLFAKLSADADVFNGEISNVAILSNCDYVGALAGINLGSVTNVKVSESSIKSTKDGAVAGGLVGLNCGGIYNSNVVSTKVSADKTNGIAGGLVGVSQTNSSRAIVTLSSSVASVSANYAVGGLVGKAYGSTIENCYVGVVGNDSSLSSTNSTCYIGGVVGILEGLNANNSVSVIKDTYSVINVPTNNSSYVGAIIGQNKNIDTSNKNKIYGNYYSEETSGVSNAVAGLVDPTNPESSDFGVYKKTIEQMIQNVPNAYKDESKITPVGIYYSCVSTDGKTNYYWNFDKIWESRYSQNEMPVIKADAVYTTTNLDVAGIQGEVNSFETFSVLATNPNANYKLTNSFTIDRSTVYTPIDFNGSLVGELDESGNPAFTITFVVDSEDQLVNGKVALFNILGKNAVIQNVGVEISISGLSVKSAAAMAVVNKGKLVDCKTSGTISTTTTNSDEYLAGMVSENYGTISGCTSSVSLNFDGSPSSIYVGGLVSYNFTNSVIENSRNTGNITITASTTGYVGGIVGQSDSKVSKCVNKGSIFMQGKLDECYVGGVVGSVNLSYVEKCSNLDNSITAVNVGGVAGITTGFITECMSQATLKGERVGGIICYMNKNYFTNCLSLNYLVGNSDESVVCGLGYYFSIRKKASYATHVFSGCTFGGKGTRYYESKSYVRQGDEPFVNYELCLDASIYINDLYDAKRSVSWGEKLAGFANWLGSLTPLDIAGWRADSPCSNAQAKGSDGFVLFYESGFSTDVWSFVEGEYPSLKNVAK